jgi:mannose-6-phosphate isomerase-like protein (cupin superfamily)
MARLIKISEAKKLGLPGRNSLQPISGEIGSRITVRVAEIAPVSPNDPPRGPHLHHGFEECIYVLQGTGVTCTDSGEIPFKPGDLILIGPNEKHMSRNTGTEPIRLLCFFAEPDVTAGTTEYKSF